MSFSSFMRTMISIGSAIESTGKFFDEASCKAQAGAIASELMVFCEKLKSDVDLESALESRVDFFEVLLSSDKEEIEKMGGDQITAIGTAFIELSFIGYILDKNYHDRLVLNLFKECTRDSYGDIPKKKLVKVLKDFLDERIEGLVEYSSTILSCDSFEAVSSSMYTHGLISEEAKVSDWANILFESFKESGLFSNEEYISAMASLDKNIDDSMDEDEFDEDFDAEEEGDEVYDIESLTNCFLENGWQCTKPKDEDPFNIFFARSPEDLTFFVIYHDGEFDKGEFVRQFNLASALMENGDCQLVLFFTDDEELSDALEEEIEDNFLSITFDVATTMIRSALTELQG